MHTLQRSFFVQFAFLGFGVENKAKISTDGAAVLNISLPGSLSAARRRRMTLAWSVWFMAALFVFFQFYIQLSSGEIVNSLMRSFSLSALGGGLLASTYYYVYTLLQTPAGMLMDRYGPRLILTLGALVACVGCLLFGDAHGVLDAAFGRVLMGAGAAFSFVGCLNLVSKWFPMRRFALMTSIVEGAGMLGAIVGNLWLAHIVHQIGWRTCMVASGVLAGVLSICLWLVVRNGPRKKAAVETVKAVELWPGVVRLLKNPMVWLNGTYSGLMFSVLTVFIALWAVPFFELSHHISLMASTWACCALYVGVMLGGPLVGWLDSRFDCRRWLMCGGGVLAALLLFFIIFYTSLSYIALCFALFGVGFMISAYVLGFAVANEIASPSNRATSIGFANMMCVGFAPILQPFIGYLMHGGVNPTVTNFEWAVSIIPFLMLVAAVIALFLPKRQFGFAKRK